MIALFASLLTGCADDAVCKAADPGDSAAPPAAEADTACEIGPAPAMALDEEELDFGYVALGETVTRTLQLSNDGDFPLGVSSVEVGGGTPDFEVEIDLDVVDCDWFPDPDLAGVYDFVLDPGCVLPFTVSYTATTPGEVRDAVVVLSDDAQGALGDGFQGDIVHGQAITWLRGETDGESPTEDPYVVGNVIWMEQTAMLEEETIRMGVRAFDPDGDAITYAWSTDEGRGAIVEPDAAEVEYTAPDRVDHPTAGYAANIYCVIFDEDGNQDWTFGRVAVWDGAYPLYGQCDEDVYEARGCGGSGGAASGGAGGTAGCSDQCEPACGGPSAFLLLIPLAGLSRRRARA